MSSPKSLKAFLIRHWAGLTLLGIVVLGALFRFWRLTQYPMGLNQDEAYAGYEAYCLLTTGTDSHCIPWPVYFISWGSGMNVLYSYISIPFVAVFGLTALAVRLPQAILGTVSILVAYGIGREIAKDGKKGLPLVLAAVTAADPWHIMISRFGLEANLLMFFLLLGLWLTLLGLRRPPALLGAGIAFGLSLYCYAPIWVILPFFLLLAFGYLLYMKRLRITPWLIAGVAVLGLLAVPLVLFLLVNYGLIDEIITPYISIPRLLMMRHNYSLDDLGEKFTILMQLLVTGQETLNTAQSDVVNGLHYIFSAPFWILGMVLQGIDLVRSLRRREYRPQVLFLLLFLCALPSTLLIDRLLIGRVTHDNTLVLAQLLLIGWGVYSAGAFLIERQPRLRQVAAAVMAVAYLGGLVSFRFSFFINHAVGWPFGYEEAIEAAENDPQQRKVYLSGNIHWPVLLFLTRLSPEEFQSSVTWKYYPGEFLEAKNIGRWYFDIDLQSIDPDGLYFVAADDASLTEVFSSIGMTCEAHGRYNLWYAEDPAAWAAEHGIAYTPAD